MADGVKVLRRALADCERHLGAGHPMTDTVRDNLQARDGVSTWPHSAVRLHHRRRRLGGQRARRPAVGRPDHPGARARGGQARLPLGPVHPHARGADLPDRLAVLRLEVRVASPSRYLNGRRIYHARGKVLGGSSSINGMIFQRGNPLDYERWAADPGMSSWDYAHCLPYFKRMENCLAAPGTPDEPFRGTDGPLVLERGPGHQPAVRRVLRGGAAGRVPADVRRERVPAGGVRRLRQEHLRRAAAVGGAGLPAPGHVPAEPAGGDQGAHHADPVQRDAGDRGGVRAPRVDAGVASTRLLRAAPRLRRRGDRVRRRVRVAAAAAAVRGRQRGRAVGRSASPWSRTCPGSARTCRTTWRSTSSTGRSCRCRSRPR